MSADMDQTTLGRTCAYAVIRSDTRGTGRCDECHITRQCARFDDTVRVGPRRAEYLAASSSLRQRLHPPHLREHEAGNAGKDSVRGHERCIDVDRARGNPQIVAVDPVGEWMASASTRSA